jgi:hypothetical protein
VLTQVAVQIGLLAEAALAEVALVGFLLVVDVAHVALQIGGDGEGTLAELALVGLLPGVGAQVTRQVGGPREGLAAILAPEMLATVLCLCTTDKLYFCAKIVTTFCI